MLKVNDVVVIKYNNSLGVIEKIHGTWRTLYDVRGGDGSLYSNQFEHELVKYNVLTERESK